VGGVRFAGEDHARIIGEIPLMDTVDRLTDESWLAGPPPAPGGARPPEPPEAEEPVISLDEPRPASPRVRRTVGIDMSKLDRKAFDAIDGVELEERLLVRLVQDGFAVVAASEKPDTIIFVRQEGERMVLEVRGRAYTEAREVADTGQTREALHHELAQKASALVHHTLQRQAEAEAPEAEASDVPVKSKPNETAATDP